MNHAFRSFPRGCHCVAAAFVLLVISGASAQQARPVPRPAPAPESVSTEPESPPVEPETTPTESPQPEPEFRLFGDSKSFNRFSGWGGIGGSMGQFGFARSMLVMMPAVQDDLGLSEDQKDELQEWAKVMRDRGREMAQGMRENAQEQARQGASPFDVLGMLGTMQVLLKENETGVARILDAEQRKRLDQIGLQMEGVTALARPDVAKAVRLHSHQSDRIQQIIAQARTRQVFFWVDQSRRMWSERSRREAEDDSRPSSRSSETPAEGPEKRSESSSENESVPAKPREDPDDDGQARIAQQRALQEKRAREFTQRFDAMRSGSDDIQRQTVDAILGVLTRTQRARFERLLGEPFDPDSMLRGLRPGEPRPGSDGSRDLPRSEREGDSLEVSRP